MSGNTLGHEQFAVRQALNILDQWNDTAQIVEKFGGSYYELQSIIEDAVKIGMAVALEDQCALEAVLSDPDENLPKPEISLN